MTKPIALILTDTHLKQDNIPLVKSVWQQAIDLCKELDIRQVFFGGDFFTARSAQPLSVDKAGREIIQSVLDSSIRLYLISGNHDKIDQASEDSYLDEYSHYIGCNVIRANDVVVNGNVVTHFLPYFKESVNYLQYLQEAVQQVEEMSITKSAKQHILLTHIAVDGVQNNDGSTQQTEIKTDLFKAFDKVLVGHFHNQQDDGHIYYIGSAYQSNHGEDNLKGFTILYSDGSHELRRSVFPEYIKHTVDVSDTKRIKQLERECANSPDHVRIVFTGDETKLASVDKERFNSIGIDVRFEKEIVRTDLSAVLSQSVSFDRSNISKAFEQFCELNDYQDREVGFNYLKRIEL